MAVGNVIVSLVFIWKGNYDTDTWPPAGVVAVPFDTSTVFGWYMLQASQAVVTYCYAFCMSSTATLFLSSCFYIKAFSEHFIWIIDTIEEDIILYQLEKCKKKQIQFRKQIQQKIIEAVDLSITTRK